MKPVEQMTSQELSAKRAHLCDYLVDICKEADKIRAEIDEIDGVTSNERI